ncbi:threonyl-tRNA synthetase [Ignicoccus pacificus DSM 13166]|uniref:Threonine--tRNA ligase catalytic subunit n=1 Tax=Ignicoccus pacificus DSM 13166 TaxID=940294 RepID=A0A977PJS5_9CREN|nr:threonyl-tRNA synthetase [Ignicoccus pacificus DSM 13166]
MEKDHMDYAVELDIAIKPTTPVPMIGQEYGYYVGAGNPLFSVGGGVLREALGTILKRYHALRGYKLVETPILARTTLYELTGHLSFYKENMFLLDIEGDEYAIKPMNCPFHVLIFMNTLQKYQGRVPLPFKMFELGKVHRYEIAGALRGLLRVRAFTQDDAHIFAREQDVLPSILEIFDMMKDVYEKVFHIPVHGGSVKLRLSLSDKSKIGTEFMGEPEAWEFAEEKLFKAGEEIKRKYGIEFFAEEGEAAFYGPKLDVVVYLGEEQKEWQIGTVQFDFNLPKRFKLVEMLKETHGIDSLYMIHRALLGSVERFLGIYLEMFKGRLPFTLAPLQAMVVGIKTGDEETDKKIEQMVSEVNETLWKNEIRTTPYFTTKTRLNKDVRKIESTVKPPLMIYIGKKEVESDKVFARPWDFSAKRRKGISVNPSEVMSIVEDMEKDVVELIGRSVRIPVDLGYLA